MFAPLILLLWAPLFLAGALTGASADEQLDWLESYNVVWEEPSEHSGQSMPVGGHDVGLNVWVEDGDILFYLSQAGNRDENGALLKQGRVRLTLDPNPFRKPDTFRQELQLRESRVEISGSAPGAPETTVRIWVEVDRPVVHVDVDAQAPVSASITFETWRYRDRKLEQRGNKDGPRGMAMMNRTGYPGDVWLYSDTVEPGAEQVLWYHRMRNEQGVFRKSVQQQNLEEVSDELYDPFTNLTFGGLLKGDHLEADGTTEGVYAQTSYKGWRYSTARPDDRHRFQVLSHVNQTHSIDDWKKELKQKAANDEPTHQQAWNRHQDWWKQFWLRSRVTINPGADEQNTSWQLGRNYNLMRYMLACNVHGREPTLFNGGLFTYDPLYVKGAPAAKAGPGAVDEGWTPDHRQWGAAFTAQNQRLLYWPLLRTGDLDVLRPGIDFYRKGLASAKARVKQYWDHDGACFVEQISPQALPGMAMWGFTDSSIKKRHRPNDLEQGVQTNKWTRYLYQSQLEFAYMMLQAHRYGDVSLEQYLPFIDAAVRFFDEHYQMRKRNRDGRPLDENGHLEIFPSKAREAYYQATNPADTVSGLHAVLGALLELKEKKLTREQEQEYRAMLDRVPPVPIMTRKATTVIAPAASWEEGKPFEIPQLYPVFPFNMYGIGRGRLTLARRTWKQMPSAARDHISWHQGGIFTARLGLTDQAADYAIKKLSDSSRRFPTFWGPGHDWVPDHNWGGSGMIGLQEMLMQTPGRNIYLFPAWPEDWDVTFKLHAPRRTTVQVTQKDGQLQNLRVRPASRKQDVRIFRDGQWIQPQ